mmetsp:Transcript_15134/g.10993  ORF Transcript_15134/g.10993 Transcript_15134/m.10993 type:complete len:157 (-) Transcript_15134:87-557(-)
MAFKPMKMGLRVAHLAENNYSWPDFKEKYLRVMSTYQELFGCGELSAQEPEIANDLDFLRRLQECLREDKLVDDTVVMLNKHINEGKRILVEDCSSSSMDIDYGIYPYTDSFHTTTGQVCAGLGVPEEAIETTIGVFSCTSLIRKAFLNRIRKFPT